MKNIQAVVSTQFGVLSGIFDKGDKVEIELIRYKEDTIIQHEVYAVFSEKDKQKYHIVAPPSPNEKNSRAVKMYDAVIAPKSSVKSYRVKSKDGEYYDEGSFRNAIGYKSLGEIFTRLN